MSTTYNNQQPRLGLRSRLWLGLRTIVTSRHRLFASRSSRHPSRRLGRKRNTKSPKRQPGARSTTSNMTTTATTSSAIPMTSTTLFADNGKTTPSEWFPIYQGCVEHFVNVAQHRPIAQSLAAHVNILLPSQRPTKIGLQFSESSTTNSQSQSGSMAQQRSDLESGSSSFSLVPYIRRLVVTATDTPAVMQELFGEEWRKGVGAIHSQERMNYLFSAKSGGWLKTKAQYDILPYETVPFLRPLRDPQEEELQAAETQWSQWLAMEDWMVGPRSPFEGLSGN